MMKTIELLQELMHKSGHNGSSLAKALHDEGVTQSNLSRYLTGTTKEPKRSNLLPIAAYYGIGVEAFFDEALAEQLLNKIASGEFLVQRRASGRRQAATTSIPAAAAVSSTAKALNTLAEVVEALHLNVQQAGRDVLRRWSMGEMDTASATATLDAFTHVSENMKLGDARRVTQEAENKIPGIAGRVLEQKLTTESRAFHPETQKT